MILLRGFWVADKWAAKQHWAKQKVVIDKQAERRRAELAEDNLHEAR